MLSNYLLWYVCVVLKDSSITVGQQTPYQCNTKANQDDAIEPVDIVNIMGCEFITDLTCQHHFHNVCCQYKKETGAENNDTLPCRMTYQ